MNQMWAFASANPWLFLLVVILLLGFLLYSKRSFEFELGGKKIKIGGGTGDLSSIEKERIQSSTKTRVKKVMNTRSGYYNRQVKAFDNSMLRIKEHLSSEYACWVSQYIKSDDIYRNIEYVMVIDKINRCINERLVPGYIKVITENHLANKTKSEWSLHKSQVIATIKSDVFRFIEQEYLSGYTVGRNEQRSFFVQHWDFIQNEIDKSLDSARDLAIECVEVTNQIKAQSVKELLSDL